MRSNHLNENISAFLAGELSEAERKAAEHHLLECAACRKELDEQRRLSDLLLQAEPLEPSEGFADRVLDRVRREQKAIGIGRRRTVIAALALAAVIVVVVFLLRVLSPVAPTSVQIPKTRPPQHVEPRTTPQAVQPGQSSPAVEPPSGLSREETELIASLDDLEDMDLLENYDNLQNMELAVVASPGEESLQ